jgi:hypothetical protein
MALPKINHPIFKLNIPSTKKDSRFRPFLVREEKILLMAKTVGTESDIILAIKQIVNNCSIDELDVDKLTIFDLEYLFLKIRSQSVNNMVDVSYKDFEDEKIYDFKINLEEVTVKYPEKIDNNIKIGKDSGIIMKYPDAALYEDKDFLNSDDSFYQLIIRCVDKIYDKEEVHDTKNYSLKEIEEYIEDLNVGVFENVRDFLLNQPKLSYTIRYKNSLGNDRTIELNTLTDFFTLR